MTAETRDMTARTAPLFRIRDTGHTIALTLRCGHVIHYWAPTNRGYVREVTEGRPGTLGQQVAEDLAHMGDMMYVGSDAQLERAIRRAARSAAGRRTLEDRNEEIEHEQWARSPEGQRAAAEISDRDAADLERDHEEWLTGDMG